MNLIYFLLIGLVAGWLAGKLIKGGGLGLVGNLVIGVIGALIGGWVLDLVGIAFYGLLGSILTATLGACLLLWLAGLMKR